MSRTVHTTTRPIRAARSATTRTADTRRALAEQDTRHALAEISGADLSDIVRTFSL